MLLLVGGVAIYFLAQRGPSSPGSEVIDVAARARLIAKEDGLDANLADVYLRTPTLSVHQHYMGPRQLCPLHVHPQGLETTVIVRGLALVRHATKTSQSAVTVTEDDALSFPAGCAHEFTNGSSDGFLSNLVFSSPQFDHNTYIPGFQDDRIGTVAATEWNGQKACADFLASSEPERDVPLALFGGKMHLLLVRSNATVTPSAAGLTVLYVLRGKGSIAAERALAIAPKHLALVRYAKSFAIHAEEPLALVYVRAD